MSAQLVTKAMNTARGDATIQGFEEYLTLLGETTER